MCGAGDYPKIPAVAVQHPPRLFCISDTLSGGQAVAAEEVLGFAQSDLLSGEVMLLDTFAEVFLWIGAESSVNEQKQAQPAADRYLAENGRSTDTPVTTVRPDLPRLLQLQLQLQLRSELACMVALSLVSFQVACGAAGASRAAAG